ncbi:GNAT family N-acetyltransferase [Halorarum salinum]|uniref:GNAT family N-acetyltransferase n=1 Tax=Halorarum salinum TaxID=2743089 RepID=A0A7D5QGK7_9EURY|nr:GNAT family N-acetyltransferase [Halobaculum salinum]QLG64141.1 GNAT family N-acetyltransferase [Halobaculum salinum]
MSVDVRPVDEDEWNDLVDQSSQATPFHRAEAVGVVAEHAGATAHRLVGFKGNEPVGLFPVFTISKGPVTAAFSPPPDLKVNYLGPALLNSGKLKRRKRDRRHRRFVDGVLDWVEERDSPSYWHVRTSVGYDDTRPFQWRGYEVEPKYTYVVDLETTPDELIGRFTGDLRNKLRGEYDVTYEIGEEGPDAIDSIIEQTHERHREQGESFPVTATFVRDLADRLPDGAIRPYVCRVDGEFVGGLVDVESDDCASAWIGGVKTDAPVPVNDLVEWQLCRDAMERGRSSFDMFGANHERIYSYKAKFAPDLVTYYRLQRGSAGMNVASKLYKRFR